MCFRQGVSLAPPKAVRGLSINMARTQKHHDDVVITLALRTPLTKAKRGGLKDTTLDGLLFKLLEQVRKQCNFDPGLVRDICLGNVNLPERQSSLPLTCSRFAKARQSTISALLLSGLAFQTRLRHNASTAFAPPA